MRRKWTIGVLLVLVLAVAAPSDLPVRAAKDQGPLAANPQPGPFIGIQVDTEGNYEPAVAYSPNRNEYLVVWRTDQDSFTWDIWARRVSADGTLQGPSAFCVATSEGKKRTEPSVAYNPVRDEYLVVYTYEHSVTDYDIRGTVVEGDLSSKGSEYLVYQPTGIQWFVYNTQDDEYLVVWANVWGDGVHDIYAQRRHSDGSGFAVDHVAIATHATE